MKNKKNTIFFYEAFEEEETALRKLLPANINAEFTWKTIQETGHKELPTKIISIRTQSILPENWSSKLDAIISRSTGFDHLLAYRKLTRSKFKMGHLPLYCNRAVAEQALMLILALLRKLSSQIRQFKKFDRNGLTGFELQNKTLVVYGVGHIGHEIVKIGKALGMNVFGVDVVKSHKNVKYLSPESGANRADIIVCAMNLTEDNISYFNTSFFENVKDNLAFINISRGEISPSIILLGALKSKKIAAVALDVFNDEKKISVGSRNDFRDGDEEVLAVRKLMTMENVILTPHNAFNTFESVERKSEQTIEQLMFFLETGKFKWPV